MVGQLGERHPMDACAVGDFYESYNAVLSELFFSYQFFQSESKHHDTFVVQVMRKYIKNS